MRKIYSYLKGCLAAGLLLASFSTASAAITEGTFHFTSTMQLNDESISSYVSNEFDFSVTKKNPYYYQVKGFLYSGYEKDASIDDNSLVLEEYFLRFVANAPSVAFANSDGDYPEYYYDVDTGLTAGMEYYLTLTYDEAGNISIPDFTLVTLDDKNHTTTILAKFTGCKAVNPANVKPAIMQLVGDYTFKATVSDVKTGYNEMFPAEFDFTAEYREGNDQLYFIDFLIPEPTAMKYDEETGVLTFSPIDWYDEDYYTLAIADAEGNCPIEYFDSDIDDFTKPFELQATVDGSGRLSIPDFTVVKIIDDFVVPPICEIYARYSNIVSAKTDGFGDVDEVSFPGNYTITGTKLDYTTRAGEPVETTEKFKLTIGENGELLAFAGYPEEGLAELVAQGKNKGYFTRVSWTVGNAFVAENVGVSGASTEAYNESAEIKLLFNDGAYSLDDFTIWQITKETTPGDDETPDKTETVGILLYAWTDLNIVPGWEDEIVPDVSPVGVHYFDWYKTDYSDPEKPVTTKETMMFSINKDLQYTQIGGYNVDNDLLGWGYNTGSVNEEGTIWTVELDNIGNVILMTNWDKGEGIRVSGNTSLSAEGPDTDSELVLTYNAETEEWNLTDFTIWKKGIINKDGETDEEGNTSGETFTKWTLTELWSSTGEVTELPEALEGTLTAGEEEISYIANATGEGTIELPLTLEVTEGSLTYAGFQFNITLPEFLSIAEDGVVLDSALDNLTADFNLSDEDTNTYTIAAFDTENTNGYKAAGEIVTLTLTYDKAKLGDYAEVEGEKTYDVAVSKVYFSSVKGMDIKGITGVKGSVTIVDETVYLKDITIESVEFGGGSYIAEGEDITNITEGEELDIILGLDPEDATAEIDWVVTVNGEPVDNPEDYITENGDGSYTFVWGGDELASGETASVSIQATSGDVESDTFEFTVRGVLLGDSNDNQDVTVADAVTTANYIAARLDNPNASLDGSVVRFDYPNANVVDDNAITVTDVTGTVEIALTFGVESDAKPVKRHTRRISVNDNLVVSNFATGRSTVAVSLDNTYEYSALQATIIVPEGVNVIDVTKGARAAAHEMVWTRTENGNINVVLFSLSNCSFADSNDALFNIVVDAEANAGNFHMDNILASDAASNGYDLGFEGGVNAGTTGIGVIGASDADAHYFTIDGVEVANPDKGQILIRVNGEKAVKVVK